MWFKCAKNLIPDAELHSNLLDTENVRRKIGMPIEAHYKLGQDEPSRWLLIFKNYLRPQS